MPVSPLLSGDMSSRRYKPEIRVSSLCFSPTGRVFVFTAQHTDRDFSIIYYSKSCLSRLPNIFIEYGMEFELFSILHSGRSWAAASTEGLLIYSLDASLVFDPYDLDMDVTPASIRQQMKKKEWASAILLSFRLNEMPLIREVLEAVPYNQSMFPPKIVKYILVIFKIYHFDVILFILLFDLLVTVVCSSLPDVYVDKLLNFVASTLEKSNHLQFYLSWAQCLLTLHGQKLKNRSAA